MNESERKLAFLNSLTPLQKNFIQRAVEVYDLIILEEIMGVPDEISRVPAWAHDEVRGLLDMMEG